MALKATNTFSSTANGTACGITPGSVSVTISGTFVATIVIEKSIDGGTNWIPLAYPWVSTLVSLTAPAAILLQEAETCQYRSRCTWTSGTSATVRIAQ